MKRFLRLLLVSIMLVPYLLEPAGLVNATSITEWEQLRQHISALPVGEHVILLTQDISATGVAIEIPIGRNIRVESADASMRTLTQTNNGPRHFIVFNNASLTLGDNITLSGGIENNTNNSGGVQINSGGTLIMEEGSVIENNHRIGPGGAIASATAFPSIDPRTVTFFMNGGIIRNNSGSIGGGVYIENGHVTMIAGTIEDNNATESIRGGGGIYIRNLVQTLGGVPVPVETSTFTMTGGTIQGNEGATGGGVLVDTGAHFEMSGTAIITNNTAHANFGNRGGGGVALDNSTFNMIGGTISNNRNPRGAGVFIGGDAGTSQMAMSGGVIYNNTASTFGGGVAVGGGTSFGTFTMSGGEIRDNITTGTGGGVHIAPGSTFTMDHEDARIEGNQASGGGGVGLNRNHTQGDATFNLIAGTIKDNQADLGGGIYMGANAHFEMSGGYIQENRSTGVWTGGGGILQQGGTVVITDGVISHNTATSQGGGVYISTTTENAFTMTGGTISHNHANSNGGGLFTTVHTYQSPLPTGIHYTNINIGANVNFSHNTAGGGVFVPPNNATTATNIAITATRSGGFAHALNNLDINFRGGFPIRLHTVRFLDGDGSNYTLVDSIGIHEGGQLVAENIPSISNQEGYEFIGWSRTPGGEVESLIGETITVAINFYAVWNPVYNPIYVGYTFDWGLEGVINSSGQVRYNATPTPPVTVPPNLGYTFAGWLPTVGAITKDTIFTAIWNPVVDLCGPDQEVVAEGQLADQVGGEGLVGSKWELCDDGTLTVGEGFINWTGLNSPWDAYRNNINRVVFTGDITAGTSLRGLFRRLNNITEIKGLTYFDTSQVTDMSNMFAFTSSLASLDLSGWDTSNVTSMSEMFWHANMITTLDVSNWNTSNVTNMNSVFFGAFSLRDVDVSNWDTSSVTNMNQVFRYARNLMTVDVSNWDTSNVMSMAGMFTRTTSLTTVDVSNWDTSNVIDMGSMFLDATSLITVDVSNWDTSNVTSMAHMFGNTYSLIALDVSNWDTSSVTDMWRMFGNARSLVELDVSNWNTGNVINMGSMFGNVRSLTSLDVSNWNVSNVRDMGDTPSPGGWSVTGMFGGMSSLRNLDLSNWNTSNVTNMTNMFNNTTALRYLSLGENFVFVNDAGLPAIRQTEEYTGLWQGPGIAFTSAQLMAQFDGNIMAGTFVWQRRTTLDPNICEIVARGRFANGATIAGSEWRLCEDGTLEVDEGFINWTNNLSPWNAHRANITQIIFTGSITAGPSLRGLFRELTELTEVVGLTYFDTSATRDMHRMFFGASSLTAIDVTSFDTSNVTDMAMMFREATRLVELDVSGFDTGNVVDMREMFRGTQIVHLDLTGFDTSSIVNMNLMFTGMTGLRGLTLGESFSFIGSPGLPGVSTTGFTGRWQNVGDGAVYSPAGAFVFTTTQLMAQFNGSTMADTWVWQPR